MLHIPVRLKRMPYRLIQNFTAIDNSGLWAVGVLLDKVKEEKKPPKR